MGEGCLLAGRQGVRMHYYLFYPRSIHPPARGGEFLGFVLFNVYFRDFEILLRF
jgi:hypothetical protein